MLSKFKTLEQDTRDIVHRAERGIKWIDRFIENPETLDTETYDLLIHLSTEFEAIKTIANL